MFSKTHAIQIIECTGLGIDTYVVKHFAKWTARVSQMGHSVTSIENYMNNANFILESARHDVREEEKSCISKLFRHPPPKPPKKPIAFLV